MKFVTTTLAAALFGLSINAFAAVSDLSYVTHGSKAGHEQQRIGQVNQPRWSDLSAATEKGADKQVKPFAHSAGNYRFSDITSVTHR